MLKMWKEACPQVFIDNPILSQEIIDNEADNISRAMTLFTQSTLNPSVSNVNKYIVLAEVLLNPLCQTIYDARLRGFSDYIEPSEPVDASFATTLINSVFKEKNPEKRVAIFFDSLLAIRPFPPTQKHMVFLDVNDIVLSQLTMHCTPMIDRTESDERAQPKIDTLSSIDGNEDIFNELKYSIAATIVSEDLYSEDNYSELMEKIKRAMFGSELEKESVFSVNDLTRLSMNEKQRFLPSSRKVAHAVIASDHSGVKTATQYSLPTPEDVETPEVCRLQHFQEINRLGTRYKAIGEDGKIWYAKRAEKMSFNDEDTMVSGELAYFSEEEEPGKEPYWGHERKVPRFSDEVEKQPKIKGGEVQIDYPSVRERDQNRNRGSNQNSLMGMSAKEAYEEFFKAMEPFLSPEIIPILRRAFSADIKKTPENQFRPEWLHARGFSLTPLTDNPQLASNLGAAGKWVNTEMMVLERVAKWFALKKKSSTRITIKPLFDMLGESELIDMIEFEVSIEFKQRIVQLKQSLDPLKERPVFRKASDVAQAAGVCHSLLHDSPPLSVETVHGLAAAASASDISGIPASPWLRVPEYFVARESTEAKQYTASIINLKTTGSNPLMDRISEMGILTFTFTESEGVLAVTDCYNAFQNVYENPSAEVASLTPIQNEQLRDQQINWPFVLQLLDKSDYVLCHNSDFDRKVLERDTPVPIQDKIKTMSFGCTLLDIDWKARGYRQEKLSYINAQLNYFYRRHRAINDCWATLNIINVAEGALSEIFANINGNKTLLCATNLPIDQDKIDLLKQKKFRWSPGQANIPKSWYKYTCEEQAEATRDWLKAVIYKDSREPERSILQRDHITAVDRYSLRSGLIPSASTHAFGFFDATTPPTKRKRASVKEDSSASATSSKHSK